MNRNYPQNRIAGEGGLIKAVILIVIALLIVSYFGINLRQVVNDPVTQDNFGYVATSTITIWDKYLKIPATYIWKDVFLDLVWEPALDNLTRMKNGEPTIYEEAAEKRKLPPARPVY